MQTKIFVQMEGPTTHGRVKRTCMLERSDKSFSQGKEAPLYRMCNLLVRTATARIVGLCVLQDTLPSVELSVIQ